MAVRLKQLKDFEEFYKWLRSSCKPEEKLYTTRHYLLINWTGRISRPVKVCCHNT